MNKRILLLFSFFYGCCVIGIQAQEQYPTGLEFDDEAYERQPREPLYAGIKQDELPLKVDLRPYCPTVGNQGKIESCVGWAVGYGALTIARAIQNDWTDKRYITAQANSALFIYNQIKQDENCGRGAKIDEAMELVTDKGTCLAKHFDRDVNNCTKTVNREILREAKDYIVSNYVTLFGKKDDPDVKVHKVRKALADGNPVIVGLKILKNFTTLKADNKYWHPNIGRQIAVGGHAMVVVGYNERFGAFRLMNSWGKEWGQKGFIWIRYKDFKEYCKYAYVLNIGEEDSITKVVAHVPSRSTTLGNGGSSSSRGLERDTPSFPSTNDTETKGIDISEPKEDKRFSTTTKHRKEDNHEQKRKDYPTKYNPLERTTTRKRRPKKIREHRTVPSYRNEVAEQSFLAGQFAFNYVVPDEEELIFETAAVQYNGAYYRVNRTDWKIGQFFQLEAISDTKDEYIYVFSVDADGIVNFHWPRQEGLNEKFDGINESAWIMSAGSVITIPKKDSGLVLSKKGVDHLCILFSSTEIGNFKEIGEYMSDQKETFYESLNDILEGFVVPPNQINYTLNKVQFYTNSGEGYVVPIVLELEAK